MVLSQITAFYIGTRIQTMCRFKSCVSPYPKNEDMLTEQETQEHD